MKKNVFLDCFPCLNNLQRQKNKTKYAKGGRFLGNETPKSSIARMPKSGLIRSKFVPKLIEIVPRIATAPLTTALVLQL